MSHNIFNQNLTEIAPEQLRVLRNDPHAILLRGNQGAIRDIVRVDSMYMQTNYITTTERSIGMPKDSNDNLFQYLSVPSQIQISSTSANDTSAGTGAREIYIEGIQNINGYWQEVDESLVLNGQTPVSSTITNWYRINRVSLSTNGSSRTNEGDIYISPQGATVTAGVPAVGNTLAAIIVGYSISTMGIFSVPSNRQFQYINGNFWIDLTRNIRIHEYYEKDYSGTGIPTRYEVGVYSSTSSSYDYRGSSSYEEQADIHITCYTEAGTADALTYYVDFALMNNSNLI